MDFDKQINRKGTYCTQWDYVEDRFGEADLLPFTISDTDFEVPDEVINTLKNRINHGVFGYTRWNHSDFKNSILKWYSERFMTKLDSDSIVYSPSVIYSISKLLSIVSDENDGVIIQTPAYDAFYKTIKENNRKAIENSLIYRDGKYSIDFNHLDNLMKTHKVLLLCSPHNPTGRVWTADELKNIVHLAQKNDVFIISDEIHMDILRKGQTHLPICKLYNSNLAVVTSGSKTFNFPALVFSYAIIPDNRVREEFLRQLKNRDGLSSPSVLGMLATMTAYNHCGYWVDELNDYIDSNIELVEKHLNKYCPKFVLSHSESTYLLWIDIAPSNIDMTTLQKKLVHKYKVAIMDGKIYGGNGEQFLRLNIGCSRQKLQDGLERLSQAYEELI